MAYLKSLFAAMFAGVLSNPYGINRSFRFGREEPGTKHEPDEVDLARLKRAKEKRERKAAKRDADKARSEAQRKTGNG